ncbi:S-methyl-5-thioribose-1-phosphate isomerase [Roseimaritima ulvae]|nr:S-methyl-5-thioribose-1-phosphate isomerase [Roseimaritima ulvae]
MKTLQWIGDTSGHLRLIDQTRLPVEETYLDCHTVAQTHDAIRRLVVRGAPAIGIAAAYGVCVAVAEARREQPDLSVADARAAAHSAIDYLATSRPTAVNLFWALDRMRGIVDGSEDDSLAQRLLQEATAIHEQDRQMCAAMGQHGAPLLADCRNVLTHCNAGGLAASELGTALAVIYAAHDAGTPLHVYADETRPLLQGARLTAWELSRAGIDVTVLCDSMPACLMREGKIDAVIVGADRVAANGDAANKIGTYALAIVARHHGVPFYVVAPSSTFDMQLESGEGIPIEQRDRQEVSHPFGKQTVPDDAGVFNPAFDVTPADLITAIVTERGIIRPVNTANVLHVLANFAERADSED